MNSQDCQSGYTLYTPQTLDYYPQILCQYLLSNQPKAVAGGKPLAKTQKTLVREAQMLTARLLQVCAICIWNLNSSLKNLHKSHL